MLRKIRIIAAALFFTLISLLFLDYTGTLHTWFGWLAKIEFIPAILALNIVVIAGLLLMTLFFGRIYCSIICPLGVFQDFISWTSRKRKRLKFSFSTAINWLRYGMLVVFTIALIGGVSTVVSLFEPYSIWGRIVSSLFAPIYQGVNNLLAYFAERMSSYAFYSVEILIKSIPLFIIAVASLIIIVVLAWSNGRIYCNTICPVGTLLGFVSRFSILKPRIDKSACNHCGLCEKSCKASCIDARSQKIDYSRCLSCMDCIAACKKSAISFSPRLKSEKVSKIQKREDADHSRRAFLSISAAFAASSTLKAQSKKVDGGLAFIENKKVPTRSKHIVPPGASGIAHFKQHCTACQMCVSVCPNKVLRPANQIDRFMQPEMSFERGYCRPECVKCSQVCPSGAIKPIDIPKKSSIQVGQAHFIRENCVVNTDRVSCGNCARHCPVGAIHMIPLDGVSSTLAIPVIDAERCIGCGACEYLCPARPFSAIYIEGNDKQHFV